MKPKQKKVKVKVQAEKAEEGNFTLRDKISNGVRKNALQIKEEVQEQEKEFLEKEKAWETPAFLRKQQ